MTKITIATPAFGEIFYSSYVRSLFRLTQAFAHRGWKSTFSSISYSDIVESRNYLLTHWFDKTDSTHLLFLDADMGYPAELILEMVDLGEPVVGAVYPKRQIDLGRMTKLVADGETPARAIARSHDYIVRRNRGTEVRRKKGFITVDGCGTGIMLISRPAVAAMLATIPDLSDTEGAKGSPLATDLDRMIRAFEPVRTGGKLLSEDFSFCHRWREQCGGSIWVNTAHEIEHVGVHRFKARYDDRGPQVRVTVPTLKLSTKSPGPPKPLAVSKGVLPMPGKTAKIRIKEQVQPDDGTSKPK